MPKVYNSFMHSPLHRQALTRLWRGDTLPPHPFSNSALWERRCQTGLCLIAAIAGFPKSAVRRLPLTEDADCFPAVSTQCVCCGSIGLDLPFPPRRLLREHNILAEEAFPRILASDYVSCNLNAVVGESDFQAGYTSNVVFSCWYTYAFPRPKEEDVS